MQRSGAISPTLSRSMSKSEAITQKKTNENNKRRQEHVSDKFTSLVSLGSADAEDGTTFLDFLVHESVPSLVVVLVLSNCLQPHGL